MLKSTVSQSNNTFWLYIQYIFTHLVQIKFHVNTLNISLYFSFVYFVCMWERTSETYVVSRHQNKECGISIAYSTCWIVWWGPLQVCANTWYFCTFFQVLLILLINNTNRIIKHNHIFWGAHTYMWLISDVPCLWNYPKMDFPLFFW